jgi:hypothetical protein
MEVGPIVFRLLRVRIELESCLASASVVREGLVACGRKELPQRKTCGSLVFVEKWGRLVLMGSCANCLTRTGVGLWLSLRF